MPQELTAQETELAYTAVRVVKDAGGSVTFDEYDRLMRSVTYFAPLSWTYGWAHVSLNKSNNDKLCAFAACRLGLLEQDSLQKQYRLTVAGIALKC